MSAKINSYEFSFERPKAEEEPIIRSPIKMWRGLSLAFSQAQSMHAWLEAGIPVEQAFDIVYGRKLNRD